MKLPRKQAVVVRDAIERWKQDGVIREAQATTIHEDERTRARANP